MRSVLRVIVISAFLLLWSNAIARATMVDTVAPETAKAGDEVTANGSDIGSDKVAEMYLTSGGTDLKAEITEQTDKTIKFKVPAAVKPGRWALLINVKSGGSGTLLELPVKITVE